MYGYFLVMFKNDSFVLMQLISVLLVSHIVILFQVTVPIPGSQLSLPNFGSAGQPLIALPQSLQPPLQHTPPQPQAQSLSRPAQVGQPFRGLIPAGTQHSIITGKVKIFMLILPYDSTEVPKLSQHSSSSQTLH